MNELKIFNNEQFGQVRALNENDKILFCGSDIAKALGYDQPHKAIDRHCRYGTKRIIPHPQSTNKEVEMFFIPEGDVYRLITHSKLPAAEQFEKWVFDEVLPSIRKHGVFAIDELLNNPDALIAILTELKAERKRTKSLTDTVAIQNQQITEMQPKVSYYDVVLSCKDLVTIFVIAKDYGWSANRMNEYLREKGIQYKQGGKIWLLYQKYAEMGYTSTKTHSYPGADGEMYASVHTYWTQSGRLFIYNLLKSDNILPMIERTDADGDAA